MALVVSQTRETPSAFLFTNETGACHRAVPGTEKLEAII